MASSADVSRLIESCRGIVGHDAITEALHYVEVGEHEMAFEGIVLELISKDIIPPSIKPAELESMGHDFGLEEASIFDSDFWTRFVSWVRDQTNRDNK